MAARHEECDGHREEPRVGFGIALADLADLALDFGRDGVQAGA
jgi:hypothetical protein